ncbi:hypothetical protein, partial [Mobilicoccus sp.]|uniref:hypothetical protein n=1 Tax=Mobilicoccus sp. TaxID=2034349 RepID=UPI0028A18CC0
VARAAGRDEPEVAAAVEDIVGDVGATAQEILAAVLGVLDLPGVDVLTGAVDVGDLPQARLVVPPDRYARAFDKVVRESRVEDADPDAPATEEETA